METKDLKYCYKYPHPSVTTDCVVLGWDGKKLHVLLIERGREPYKGCWAFPGGFLNMDESAEEGAARELQEETGLQGIPLRQFHTFSQPGRDPRERVITIAYYAVIRWQKIQAGDDAARAQWFPLDAIPALAFDHRLILHTALQELHRQIYPEERNFLPILPPDYSVQELQQIKKAIHDSQKEHNF